MLTLVLLTLTDPNGALSGGHLYNRRMAELAPRYGVEIRPVGLPVRPFPLSLFPYSARAAALEVSHQAVLVDSLVAHRLLPAQRPGPELSSPPPPARQDVVRRPVVIGLVHQPPGGLDHGWLRRRLQERADLRTYRSADACIATSQLLADALVARGVPRERVAVVLPGRASEGESERRGDGGRRSELRQGRRCAVLCVANWLERKGVHYLVEAVGRLPERYAILHLVGDTRPRSAYGRRVSELVGRPELAGRMVVHGPLPERALGELYASADVFALPSRDEPYGMVYGEALAAGLPVVGFRSGNLPSLVRHEAEGLLVPPGDVGGLTRTLGRLVEDEPLRIRLGQAARLAGSRLPSWSEAAERFCRAINRFVSDER